MFFSNMFPESMPSEEERRRLQESATVVQSEIQNISDPAFLRRLEFVKWLIAHGRISDWPTVPQS